MEPSQTASDRAQPRHDPNLVFPSGFGAPLALDYLTQGDFQRHQARHAGQMMGAVAFGARQPRLGAPECPHAWVEMPVLGGETVFEVWTSAQPVVREDEGALASARNEDVLFGCLRSGHDCTSDTDSDAAYRRIFDCIDRLGYRHLLRVWNYLPQINADADGLERYVRFNAGRHEAFVAKGRVIGVDTPAACALGSSDAGLVIYFLAARCAGQVVENPRQISAFHYPPQYGARSPTFARAMLMQTSAQSVLFVSGTASIVGHETMHVGNAVAQTRETVANLRAVFAQAQLAGFSGPDHQMLLKAYLRRPEDLTVVRNGLTEAFGRAATALYLQADICRSGLLVEVEAVCRGVDVLLR